MRTRAEGEGCDDWGGVGNRADHGVDWPVEVGDYPSSHSVREGD